MNSPLQRRQAILTGLARLLPEEQLVAAVAIWDRDFAGSPSHNLLKFLDRIYDALTPPCDRRTLHRALVSSVFLDAEAECALKQTPPPSGMPANRIFEHLLGGFLAGLAVHGQSVEAAIRGYLIDRLPAVELGMAAQDALFAWFTRSAPTVDVPLSREAMRRVLNTSYVLACEYLGPAAADHLLAHAVARTAALPEARVVAPRELL